MLLQVLSLAVGLVLVIKGGDMFVDSSVSIAKRLGLPRIVVGGTLVSLATTAPELVVSATASVMSNSGIAIGNAVGSAICNIGLIVGTVAVLVPVSVDPKDFRARSLWMLGCGLLLIAFSWQLHLGRIQGFILVFAALAYLLLDAVRALRAKNEINSEDDHAAEMPLKKAIFFFLLGAGLVLIGSRLLVTSGIYIAEALGIPSAIIGLSIIAVGTSLPELVTAVTAARKKVPDLSIGNIVGANVLNLGLITGSAAVINPLTLSPFTRAYSFLWLGIFVFAMIFLLAGKGTMTKKHGVLFLFLYGIYIAGLVIAPMAGVRA